jgi:putative toxin-antitoxin system antitoxin component (TIGR02293 family)
MPEKKVAALLGAGGILGRRPTGRLGIADAVARGLPQAALGRLKSALGLADREIASALGISAKTIGRLRKTPRSPLDAIASDRLYRMAVIFAAAREALEDDAVARTWLRAPQVGLGNRVPLDLLKTEAGAREVEDLLGRIEHGVLS